MKTNPGTKQVFRMGLSTINQQHGVNLLIEKCANYKILLVKSLEDYKAFAPVEIPDINESLKVQVSIVHKIEILSHQCQNYFFNVKRL